jgi:hypothetical protein
MRQTLASNQGPSNPAAAHAVTAPSGADRASRAQQCDAQAARQGLRDAALQAFRQSCLASAAPVDAVGYAQREPTPTPAKPNYDALTDAPRH